jgi:hypothetical protein
MKKRLRIQDMKMGEWIIVSLPLFFFHLKTWWLKLFRILCTPNADTMRRGGQIGNKYLTSRRFGKNDIESIKNTIQ